MFVNSTIVLISAVLASLAVGVLVGYVVCMAMFAIFRTHAKKVAAVKMAGRVVASTRAVQG
jgi:hypothetical protein